MTTGNHTVSVVQVERMLQGARRHAIDVDRILRLAGISPILLSSPIARVSHQKIAALMRVLVRTTKDEFWGLCKSPVRIGSFGTACRLMAGHQKLGSALREGLQFYHYMLDDFAPRLKVVDGKVSIDLIERSSWDEAQGFAQSTFLFFGVGVASWLIARKLPLLQVRLRNPRANYNAATRWLFETDILYSQKRAGISFDAKWLDAPVVQEAHKLAPLLSNATGSLILKYRDRTSATERTRNLLRRRISDSMLTLDEVAALLFMTPQTLRRRLHGEGNGFQSIKDDLRRDMAIEYLGRSEMTLQSIAQLVGFSESSTFHRAFKAWTGVAPGEYRQRALDDNMAVRRHLGRTHKSTPPPT